MMSDLKQMIKLVHYLIGQMCVTPVWWSVGMITGGVILTLCIWLTNDRIDAIVHYHKITEEIQTKERKLKKLKLSIFGIENREKKIDEEQKNIDQARRHLKNQRKRFDDRKAMLEDAISEYNRMYSNVTQCTEINKRTENEIKARISSKDLFAVAMKPYVKTIGRTNNYLQNQEVKLALTEEFSDSPLSEFVEKIYSLLVGKGVPSVVAAWLLYRSLSGIN